MHYRFLHLVLWAGVSITKAPAYIHREEIFLRNSPAKGASFLYRTVSVYVAHAYTRVKTNLNTSASNGERGLDTKGAKARTLLNFQKFHIVVCSKSVSLLLFF